MAKYEFYLTDDAGRRITLLRNIAFMSISRAINGYGTCHIGMPFQDFKIYPAFLPDRRLEVWRSPRHGATLRREGSYFLRKYNVYTRDEDNVQIIEFYGRSPLDILRRQAVTSTTLAKYQKTDFIDDMMKEIVSENFISPQQTAPAGELTVDGEESLGPSVSHTFFSQNVLDVLKDLRDVSISLSESDSSNTRIYFDVVEGSPLSNGGFGYTFRTYANLRGTDRTGGKVFSVENGNIKAPSYYEDHLDSFTVAKILNLSTPAANGEATSPESTLSRWNTIVSAQQSSETTAALNESKANSTLQDGKSDISFNPTILDSPGSDRQPRSLYGVDWDLGDLLPIRYADKNINVEVNTVYLSVDEDGKENIVGLCSIRQENIPQVPLETSISYLIQDSSQSDLTTYDFTGLSFGDEDSARYIIAEVCGIGSALRTVSSVTIGGVSATEVITVSNGNSRNSLYIALVPSGTSGTVSVVWSGTQLKCGVALWRAVNINPVAEDTGTNTANPSTSNLSVSEGSVQIASVFTNSSGSSAVWSGTNGPTEDFDTSFVSPGAGFHTGASRKATQAESVTATCTLAVSSGPCHVSASFARA